MRRIYLCTEQVEYNPSKKKRQQLTKIKKCLNSHRAGCTCWRKQLCSSTERG